jgi:HD superfamily phosphohydrolase
VGLRKEEVRALMAAILIHDAASPPFAHLLEYYLKDRAGWSHEAALPTMLTGHHALENVAHQILPGEELKFRRLCETCDVDFEIVLQIVRKKHPASMLLFGSLDFDNLDNVARMSWSLGLKADTELFLRIARELSTSLQGEPILSMELKDHVEAWSKVRRDVYNILVFDELTVSSQAVLTKAIRLLFSGRDTRDIEWTNRDRDLLDLLTRAPETKELMLRYFYQSMPAQVLGMQLHVPLDELGFPSRDAAIDFVEEIARDEFDIKRPFGYAFVDRGIFSKKLEFLDPATRKKWTFGQSSNSVILYCFTHHGKGAARIGTAFRDAVLKRLARLGKNVDDARKCARLTG